MDKYPKVSIITLTYNNFNKLFFTIGSILLQDYASIELIVCDDGSDCFPKQELIRFIEANNQSEFAYKVIDSKTNVGTVRNANRAYKASTGQYIFNLSCGDFFAGNQVVSQIISRMEVNRADLLVATRLRYRGEFEPVCLLPHLQDIEAIKSLDTPLKRYKALVCGRFFDMASGSAVYFRRSLIESLGYYDERFTLWEDGPFFEKYFWKGDVDYAYDIVSIWYQDGGVSSTKLEEKHPALKADTVLFFKEDAHTHIDAFSRFEKRQIKYQEEKNQTSNAFQRMTTRLKHPFVTLSYFAYFSQRKRKSRGDLGYLESQKKDYKRWISILGSMLTDQKASLN